MIKAAYRGLARRYHPDLNRTDPGAEERLKKINAAYAVLSDPAKRPAYNLDWDQQFNSATTRKSPSPTPPPPRRQKTQPPQPPPRASTPPPNAAPAPQHLRKSLLRSPLALILMASLLIGGFSWVASNSSGRTGGRNAPTRADLSNPTATRSVADEVSTSTPRPSPKPAATGPASQTQAAPPVQGDDSWGFYDAFVAGVPPTNEPGGPTWTQAKGQMTLVTTAEPDRTSWLNYGVPSSGRDASFRLDIAGTTGSGAVVLIVGAEDETPIWAFRVDPTQQQWSVDRRSEQLNQFFEWVVPRSYAASQLGSLKSLELQIVDGTPLLFINGVDVAAAAGVRLDDIPGSVTFGFGGSGERFEVSFDDVELAEVRR